MRVWNRLLILSYFFSVSLAAPEQGLTQDWQWPEKAENLKVLPPDFPKENLRAVMTGFTRALGVRCSHCHVGEEGKPLNTYDFQSDDNSKKNVARQMLTMLGDIHEHLAKIEPPDQPVNMWCHTCHAGRARPMTLGEELGRAHEGAGIEEAVSRYRDLRERYYGRGAYDFSENILNNFGYRLLDQGNHEAAVEIMRLNVEFHPQSSNAYDSLGEAHFLNGDLEMARESYQKAIAIDPNNEHAKGKLEEIGNDG